MVDRVTCICPLLVVLVGVVLLVGRLVVTGHCCDLKVSLSFRSIALDGLRG